LNKGKKLFTFYDGPPFATGLPHYGHILAGTIKDIITRWAHQVFLIAFSVLIFSQNKCRGYYFSLLIMDHETLNNLNGINLEWALC